jgi:hypothetical protein
VISSTTLSQIGSIFGLPNSRSCMIFSARSSSRRWTSQTLAAMFDRYSASSTAVLPPPITATSLSRKKKPSQVAQADTPPPWNFCSDSRPSQRACAPVAMITVSAEKVLPPRQVDFADQIVFDQLGADMFGLGLHLLHQPRALDGFGETRIVLDIRGDGHLAALGQAGYHERLQVGARRVDRRRIARRTGADDQDLGVVVFSHANAPSRNKSAVPPELIPRPPGRKCAALPHGVGVARL